MMERPVVQYIVEYVVNCAWQIPLLGAGAWLMVKIVRPGVLAQHWLWLSVLAMGVVLPLRGLEDGWIKRAAVPVSMVAAEETRPIGSDSLERAGASQTRATVGYESVPLPLRGRSVRLSVAATQWLAGLYALSIAIGALRLGRGLMAARRLARGSRNAALSPDARHILAESCRRLKAKAPQLRESEEVDGPVIVGAIRPVLLLPERFEEHPEDEIGAALLHELAHVRRRDYLVNLICQIVALPVIWHPAVHGIQQRIRRTREMACDAIAADVMGSGAEYARCLVSLARGMLRDAESSQPTAAMGLFESNTMEERVMNLTVKKAVSGGRAKLLRAVCGAAAMAAVTASALTIHVRPTFAAVSTEVDSDGSVASASGAAVAAQAKPSAQVTGPEKTPERSRAKASDKAPLAIARGDHAHVTAGKGDYVHRWKAANGEPFALVNRDPKEPTVEERRLAEMQLADPQTEIDEATKWIGDFKFKRQFDWADDPATKLRMKELQQHLSDTMPELKKFDDPQWQKQFAELAKNQPQYNFDFGDLKKQIEDAKLSAIDQAKLNETIANAMDKNKEQMAKLQKEMESGELRQKLDEATRLLDEVRKQMETTPAK